MRRLTALDILTTLVALCAITVTALVLRREFARPRVAAPRALVGATADELPSMPFSDWRDFVEGGRRMGPESANVTVVVFSDYECPYCRVFAASLRAAAQARPGLFLVVLHHYPVDATHPEARAAAIAAECAADQSRFWPMHDSLFAHLEQFGTGNWTAIARGAGVPDLDRFAACLSVPEVGERVQRGVDLGRRYGIKGTPSFLVNDRRVDGAAGTEYLIALLDSAMVSVEESR